MAVVKIPTQARLKELLDYNSDTGEFVWKVFRGNSARAGSVAGNADSSGHIQIKVDGVSHLAHRLAWLYVYGVWPTKNIDHINCVRDDNRIANLREATAAENSQNRREAYESNKTSGLLGVCWHERSQKWRRKSASTGRRSG